MKEVTIIVYGGPNHYRVLDRHCKKSNLTNRLKELQEAGDITDEDYKNYRVNTMCLAEFQLNGNTT